MCAPYEIVYLTPIEGCDPTIEPLVHFRLTYEGELRPTGRDPQNGQRDPLASHKQKIRKVFHGQLKKFWSTHKFLNSDHTFPASLRPGQVSNFFGMAFLRDPRFGPQQRPLVDTIADNFQRNGYRFVPLVCEAFSLLCTLDILFLRRDHPLGVISAGDLDNRVKTLIDTLRMPKDATELVGNERPAAGEDPFFCLLEDDDLVTGLTVQSDMLLEPSVSDDGGNARVKLIISVELKPDDVTMFNLGFA